MLFCCELSVFFVAPREPRRARAGRSASVRRSALRTDFPAMLATVARRTTRCVRCALSAQTSATSQLTKRAARAATATALLGAPQARSDLPAHALAEMTLARHRWRANTPSCCGRRCPVGAMFRGGCVCPSGAGRANARFVSDLRPLFERRERQRTQRVWPHRPQTGGHSGVGATRRPPWMSPRRAAPAAAARCKERDVQRSTRSTPVIPKGAHTTARREEAFP
jgi:hypothetical protein